MKIGIFAAWLLAAVIAIWIGGFPADLCFAGAAVGISVSLAAAARSRNSLAAGMLPVMIIVMRYVIHPALLTGRVPQGQEWLVAFDQCMVSPAVLIVSSFLSMIATYLLGMRWTYTGEV